MKMTAAGVVPLAGIASHVVLGIAIGTASAIPAPARAQPQTPYPQPQEMRSQPVLPSSSGGGAYPGWHADSHSSGPSNGMQAEAGMEYDIPSPIADLHQQKQNDVTFLCGGVGEEEASYMKQQAKRYDLMLTFATHGGAYLADVDVSIRNAKGDPVLQTNCDGPMLLVALPRSGTYRIRAETSGYSLDRTARVTAQGRQHAPRAARLAMVWPADAAEGGSAISSGNSANRGHSRSGSGRGIGSESKRDGSGGRHGDPGAGRAALPHEGGGAK